MSLSPNGIEIKGPRCQDTALSGLLSVVTPTSNVDPHWTASGIWWEDLLCSPGVTGFIDQCPPVSGFTKPAERNNKFCQADPFILVGSYKCPPVGRDAGQSFEIARQRLLKWEERQLEQTLWTGAIANGSGFVNPSFAFGNNACNITPVDLSPSGAVSVVGAISLMEEALGDVSGCGVIHAPYGLASFLKNARLLEKDGNTYYTPTGFPIVLGHGYPGSGPANVPAVAGETWIFGTGPLVMTRSSLFQVPDNIPESVNRRINDLEVRAERFYAIGFSCALFAVRVNLCNISGC